LSEAQDESVAGRRRPRVERPETPDPLGAG